MANGKRITRKKRRQDEGRKLVSFWASPEMVAKAEEMYHCGGFQSRAAALEAMAELGLSVAWGPQASLVELSELMERMSTLLEGHLQRLFFACLRDFMKKAEALAEATEQE